MDKPGWEYFTGKGGGLNNGKGGKKRGGKIINN
jgi:hypothetical protein